VHSTAHFRIAPLPNIGALSQAWERYSLIAGPQPPSARERNATAQNQPKQRRGVTLADKP